MRALVPCWLLVAALFTASPLVAQRPLAPDWLATAVGETLARALALDASTATDGSIRIAARHDRLPVAAVVLVGARVGGQLRPTVGDALVGDIDVRIDELRAWRDLFRVEDVRISIAVGAERTTVTATGRLGSRPIELTASLDGRVDRDGWTITAAKGTIRGDRVLLVDADDVRLRARVSLDFTADRESGARVRGEIVAQSGRYLRDVPGPDTNRSVRIGPPAIDTPWAHAVRLDVRLGSERALTIDSQSFEARVEPALTLGGTAAAPTLEGAITATRGTFFSVTGDIPIERAKLVFYERDPGRPYLDAVAHKRVAGYDVRVSATGPLDALSIGYAATPPLPREDIASLLAFGGLRSDLDDRGAAEAAGLLGLRYAYTQLFPRRRGADPTWFDDLVGRLEIETVPARSPQDAAKQIRALVRIGSNLYIRGERDRYAETNFDLMLRFRFGKPQTPADPGRAPARR